MNTRHRLCAAVLAALAVLLAACGGGQGSGAVSNPTPGLFSGTTSQDYPISVRVEERGGELVVTEIKYTIEMAASGWSVTTELVQPETIEAIITDGRFSYSTETPDGTEEISGAFAGDEGLSGRLKCTHVHPQGLGTATGDVTFTASR
jgi:hypothetical protein